MNSPTSTARLLADVGGTNARFAWQAHPDAPIEAIVTLPCAAHGSLSDAIHSYLRHVKRARPTSCAIAIANPVVGDRVTLTNGDWTFSIRELKAQMGFERFLVLNDFTALALALPSLRSDQVWQLGGREPLAGWAIGLIGPGTGLGVSGLVPDGRGGWLPIAGEGGHSTMAATTERERAVLLYLAERHGHASAERAICGQGLVDIHRALVQLNTTNAPEPNLAAEQITQAALNGEDARCIEALELFCGFLGIAAGNLALTLGAKGGVYIGGGIVPRLGQWFASSPFRARFDAKGRMSAYVNDIPVYVINASTSPAFVGAANALDAQAHAD